MRRIHLFHRRHHHHHVYFRHNGPYDIFRVQHLIVLHLVMLWSELELRTLFFETYALDCRTLKLTFYKIVIGLKFHTGCADW